MDTVMFFRRVEVDGGSWDRVRSCGWFGMSLRDISVAHVHASSSHLLSRVWMAMFLVWS